MSSRHPTVYSTSPLGHLNIISSITYPKVICAPFQHKSPILVCRKFFLAFAQAKTWERFLTFFPSHPTSSLSVNPVSLTFKWISALTISHLLHSYHHLSCGLPPWSPNWSPCFSPLPSTVYSQWQPEVAIYQNAGLIMSLLYSKLSRCFHFSKRKLQTLKMTCKAPSNQPTFPPSLPHSLTSLTSSLLALSHAHLSQARLASLLVFTHLQPLCWSFLCS